jgi:CRISPR-associated protein Cmr2
MNILVIAIGPVQEFIESARKCRDLWFGSWLLSELARAAAQGIVDAERRDEAEVLVFPGVRLTVRDRAVANKIVARLHLPPVDVAQVAEKKMRERLEEIRIAAFARVAPGLNGRKDYFREREAIDQVEALIEFLWAAVPEIEGKRGYANALAEAERLLAAVKNSKQWGQPTWAKEGVPKSSLDGIRESVLDERLYDRPKNQSQPLPISDRKLRRLFGVHGAERLCGVGLLKRFGSTDTQAQTQPQRIFSTAHVASGPFRAGLRRIPGAASAWEQFCAALKGIDPDLIERLDVVPAEDPTTGRIDGSIFYEGRLVESLEELGLEPRRTPKGSGRDLEDFEKNSENLEKSRNALRSFLRAVRPLGEPMPYYALLLADGDRMGKAIGDIKVFSEHQRLSKTLEDFASSTRKTVQDHEGALIYAGGDDVLALLPLHRLLDCARKLADDFHEQMKDWKVQEPEGERTPTLSVGVAIVHHLLPLDEALALVRKTEKIAKKKVLGKNALAITVKKRGGEPIEVKGIWGQIDVRLRDLILLHQHDTISVKTQYELMDLEARLGDVGDKNSTLFKVREAETRRILARKKPKQGSQELTEETRKQLGLMGAYSDPASLGRELYVARILEQARAQANPSLDDPKAPTIHQEVRS